MSLLSPWRAHLVLLLLLAAQSLVALTWHRDRDELVAAWRRGSGQERLAALHVLTNRGEAKGFGQDFVREMLQDPDLLVREAAMGLDLAKFSLPMAQEAYLSAADFGAAARGEGPAGLGRASAGHPPEEALSHWWRAYFLHRRKVGGYIVGSGVRPRRQEVTWFLDALEDKTLPREPIGAHIRSIQLDAVRRQTTDGPRR
jgi:hypothetical protein